MLTSDSIVLLMKNDGMMLTLVRFIPAQARGMTNLMSTSRTTRAGTDSELDP